MIELSAVCRRRITRSANDKCEALFTLVDGPAMVEKEKRIAAANLIEELFSARITNYEYDDRFPQSEADPGLKAIYEMLWFSYSDVREHRLDASKFTDEQRQFLDTVVLFLRSDFEYVGPRRFIDLFGWPKRFWHWVMRRPVPELPASWPFENDQQLRCAQATVHND